MTLAQAAGAGAALGALLALSRLDVGILMAPRGMRYAVDLLFLGALAGGVVACAVWAVAAWTIER